MYDFYPDGLEQQREMAVDRYILALDRGDLDTIAEILALAAEDPELDRRIIGVNTAFHAESGLQPIEEQARLVRRLAYRYLPSGIPAQDELPKPLTVGDVAALLKAEHAKRQLLPPGDRIANDHLIASVLPLLAPVTTSIVARVAAQERISASDRYWELFRRAAVMLAMTRQRDQTLRTAARSQTDTQHSKSRRRPSARREEES